MKGYQAGIDKFKSTDTVVFGVSADDEETNARFAKELGLEFALLSDPSGEMLRKYGVYNEERKIASRTTFVIDKQGKIVHAETGGSAIDITGAADACSRLK